MPSATPSNQLVDEIAVAIASAATDHVGLALGIELAGLLDTPLRLIHVTTPTHSGTDASELDVDPLDQHLQTTAPNISTSITSVEATDVVTGLVGELEPRSLVVLESNNASRWSGKTSVAEHVLDAFSGLVVMTGPAFDPTGALDRRVLIALDGSVDAERALPVAGRLAEYMDQSVLATRVVPTSADATAENAAIDYLETITGRLPNATAITPTSNDPIAAILDASNDDVGLIVLSSHGDRASERSTISRTSMGLVQSATVPVVLVGPDVS